MSDNLISRTHDTDEFPPEQDQASQEPTKEPSSEGSTSGRFNLDFLKLGLGSRKKDGEKPKRRGPKPDAKPAQTRRQELNRQAQRTHRERKEQYTKALEEKVNQLQVDFSRVLQEKTRAVDENRRLLEETSRLKALLDSHGIPYSGYPTGTEPQRLDVSFTPPPEVARFGRTYNEIGIDFVLALEKPCMDHIQVMFENLTVTPEADFHGHRMLMSCPIEPTYTASQHVEVPWGVQTWDLAANELSELFNMQNRFELDGELTPIVVWAMISQHQNFSHLDLHDFTSLAEELVVKVKCHGFGAVIEDFEVEDSLVSLFSKKQGSA